MISHFHAHAPFLTYLLSFLHYPFTVDPSDAPDYYRIVQNPMDFTTMKKKLQVSLFLLVGLEHTETEHTIIN